MSHKRSELTSRVIPQMTLTTRDSASQDPAAHLRSVPSQARAKERFRIAGNAIVTGGAGDLGIAACRALLEHGLAGLAIFDLDRDAADQRIRALKLDFPAATIVFVRVDVTDAPNVEAAVAEAAQSLGGPIDILAHFAGVVGTQHALDLPVEEWRRILDINATGAFVTARAVARHMVAAKAGGGSIVLVASISGHTVNFPQPQVAYNASKAAVLMITKSLAAEWAVHGIRVNCISPGYMDTILNEGAGLDEAKAVWTSRNPMGRMGNPEELCGVVVLLASRAGSYINGADILVDGGMTLF